MTLRMKLLIAAGLGIAVVAGTSAYAMQADAAGQLRASGLVGEQADGYLGLVGSNAPAAVRAQMEQVNIQRRAAYTQLATQRGATIEEVAATTACELFRTKIGAGQYYRLPDGVWRQRDGSTPIPLPSYCG